MCHCVAVTTSKTLSSLPNVVQPIRNVDKCMFNKIFSTTICRLNKMNIISALLPVTQM